MGHNMDLNKLEITYYFLAIVLHLLVLGTIDSIMHKFRRSCHQKVWDGIYTHIEREDEIDNSSYWWYESSGQLARSVLFVMAVLLAKTLTAFTQL